MTFHRQLISMIGLCVVASCASAPPQGRGGPPKGDRAQMANGAVVAQPFAVLFTGYDGNADRIITAAEFQDGLAAEWTNANGGATAALSTLQLQAWKQRALGHVDVVPGSRRFDPNGDRSITETEFSAFLAAQFERMDRDGNGDLSREELVRQISVRSQDAARRPSGQGGGRRGGERGEGPPRR